MEFYIRWPRRTIGVWSIKFPRGASNFRAEHRISARSNTISARSNTISERSNTISERSIKIPRGASYFRAEQHNSVRSIDIDIDISSYNYITYVITYSTGSTAIVNMDGREKGISLDSLEMTIFLKHCRSTTAHLLFLKYAYYVIIM